MQSHVRLGVFFSKIPEISLSPKESSYVVANTAFAGRV